MKLKLSTLFIILCISFSTTLYAQHDSLDMKSKAVKNVLLLVDNTNFKMQGHLQFGLNAVAETNLFWNLADVPTLDFNSDTQWLESYVKPGISLHKKFGNHTFYGKISAVGSYTLGTDAFDFKNTGRITLEEAYLDYRFKIADSTKVGITVGSQELKLGTGMIISNGASSGFERGALKLGPRKAWEKSAIIELENKKINSKIFYIEPNELPSNDTKNKLTGIDVNYTATLNKYLGLSYLYVINSLAPYPQAALFGQGPPSINVGAREGLHALNFYVKTNPFNGKLKNIVTTFDFTYEWNESINMNAWGGRMQIGYNLFKLAWKPTLMYTYQSFSGDNPNTKKQERFDPLYFEGSPSAWSTGSKSSMVFINSNVQSHGISLRMMPTPKDIITLRYTHIMAQQLHSPIQFGQATRIVFSEDIPTVISGVTNINLADDIFLEYNRIITQNIYLNAGFSISFPGKGIRNITNSTSNWTGGFINMVFDF